MADKRGQVWFHVFSYVPTVGDFVMPLLRYIIDRRKKCYI